MIFYSGGHKRVHKDVILKTRRLKTYIIVLCYNIIIRGVRGDTFNTEDAFLVDLPAAAAAVIFNVIIIILKPLFV